MSVSILRRGLIATTAVLSLSLAAGAALAADKVKLRLSSPASENDERAIALTTIFAPAVNGRKIVGMRTSMPDELIFLLSRRALPSANRQ